MALTVHQRSAASAAAKPAAAAAAAAKHEVLFVGSLLPVVCNTQHSLYIHCNCPTSNKFCRQLDREASRLVGHYQTAVTQWLPSQPMPATSKHHKLGSKQQSSSTTAGQPMACTHGLLVAPRLKPCPPNPETQRLIPHHDNGGCVVALEVEWGHLDVEVHPAGSLAALSVHRDVNHPQLVVDACRGGTAAAA